MWTPKKPVRCYSVIQVRPGAVVMRPAEEAGDRDQRVELGLKRMCMVSQWGSTWTPGWGTRYQGGPCSPRCMGLSSHRYSLGASAGCEPLPETSGSLYLPKDSKESWRAVSEHQKQHMARRPRPHRKPRHAAARGEVACSPPYLHTLYSQLSPSHLFKKKKRKFTAGPFEAQHVSDR